MTVLAKIPVQPVAERAETSKRPRFVFCHSLEYSKRLKDGTARLIAKTPQVKIERQFRDISQEGHPTVWHDVWIPTNVNDFMPVSGLWDVLMFWNENAEPVK